MSKGEVSTVKTKKAKFCPKPAQYQQGFYLIFLYTGQLHSSYSNRL